MSIIQAIIGTNLTISAGGGGGGGGSVNPDGTFLINGITIPWAYAGIAPSKPVYNSAYNLPDQNSAIQMWEFNGSNQLMTTPSSIGFTELYVNIWFYPQSLGRTLMTVQDTLAEQIAYHYTGLELNSDGTVSGTFYSNAYITTANTVNLNDWNHIYFRHNGTQTLLQLNGGTAVTANNSWSYPSALVLGFGTVSVTNSGQGNTGRYHGWLGEFEMNPTPMASDYDTKRTKYEAPQTFIYDDFTVEWWQKAESNGQNSRPWAIGLLGSPSGQEFAVSYEGVGRDYFWLNDGYANGLEYQPLKNHYGIGWEHMALVRKDGILKAYSNGSNYMTWPYANSAITATNADLVVGTGEVAAGNFQGYIKELHIIKGYAKYTTNFLVPTSPIQPETGSVFLLPAVASGGAYDDVIGYKSATLVNTPTWSSDTPYTAAGPVTQFTNQSGFGGGGYFVLTFAGGTYNPSLVDVRTGWTVSQGGSPVATVSADPVTGDVFGSPYIQIQLDVDLSGSVPGTFTFTQPDVGGSLYFDTGDYINYGSSVDWAFDVDGIATANLTLNLDANNPASYSGSGSTWNDLSVGNFPFTLYGSPYYTAGSQSSLNFNGTTQYATGPAVNMLPDSEYSKMVWFRLNDLNADNNLVSSDGGGHYMFFSGGNKLYAGHSNVPPYQGPGAFGSIATFTTDTWYCATVTYSVANGISIYVNGVQDNNTAMIAHTGNGSTNLACFGAGGNLLNGKIGRVLCYSRELTAQEVLNNFNATRNRYGI